MTGKKWKLTPTPNPTPASAAGIPYNHLAGVSCPTTNHCVAVGEYHSNSTADLQTLVETWNGHRWTRTKSPNKPQGSNNDSRLRSVACASTLACTAVGSFAPNNPSQTLVETWNGVRWAIRRSPDAKPAGIITTNELTSVSCVSPFACAAVGDTMAGFTADSNTITQTLTLFGPAVPRPHVRLTPTRSTPAIGLAQCLQAKVTDTAGHRLVRTPVAFKVTGANSHKSTKRTDRSGVATFCYVGRRAGVDHVVATVYGIGSNRAKVSWTKH
jgi:hypothetical protein